MATPNGLKKRTYRTAFVSAGLLTLGLAAGCSNSDDNVDTGIDSTRPTVKIGVLANITGPSNLAESGGADVLQAWATHANKSGGIDGNNVELDVVDTRADAPTLTAGVNELIADPSTVAVVSFVNGLEGSVGTTLSDAGLPVIGGLGYNPEVWSALPGWFGVTTTTSALVGFQVASALAAGAKTAVVASCAESSSCSAAEPLYAGASEEQGLDFQGTVKVSANAPNFTAECLEFSARGAEMIQLAMKPEVAARLATDCRTQGYEGYFGATAGTVSAALYESDGIRLAGALNAFPWTLEAAPVEEFRQVMYDAGIDSQTYGQPTGTAAWATGQLFAKTMGSGTAAAPTAFTRTSVLAAYEGISGETLDGLLPMPLSFTPGEPAPLVNCAWLYTLKEGTFTVDGAATCL